MAEYELWENREGQKPRPLRDVTGKPLRFKNMKKLNNYKRNHFEARDCVVREVAE